MDSDLLVYARFSLLGIEPVTVSSFESDLSFRLSCVMLAKRSKHHIEVGPNHQILKDGSLVAAGPASASCGSAVQNDQLLAQDGALLYRTCRNSSRRRRFE